MTGFEIFLIVGGCCSILSVSFFAVMFKNQSTMLANMKMYMELFDVKKVKEMQDILNETKLLHVDAKIEKFRTDLMPNVEKIIEPKLIEASKELENIMKKKYDEISEGVYNLLLTLPIDQREPFVHQHLPLTKEDFLNELREYDELP